MPHRLALLLTCLHLLAWGSLSASAQQFKALLVHLKPADAAPAGVIVSGDKVRFETTGPAKRTIVVVDLKERTGFMALPDDKMYSLLQSRQISAAIPLFHPEDPEDACASWEKSAGKPGTCSKIGDESINGRSAVKYKGTAQNGDTGSVWVDRKLRFVIKWEGKASAAELQNIQEGPQKAGLFELPAGYEKMSAQSARPGAPKKRPATASPTSPKPQN